MTVFNLKSFPNVCRLCLQPKSSAEVVTLDSYRPLYGCTIIEMLEEVSFKVPVELACFLPIEMCEQCLDVFEFFYKYKRKVNLIQRFACCLAEVKCGDQQPLEELFDCERDQLQLLFRDLDICDKEDFQVVDLLNEFPEYDIANAICVKVETDNENEDDTKIAMDFTIEEVNSFTMEAELPEVVSSFLGEFQRALVEQEDQLPPIESDDEECTGASPEESSSKHNDEDSKSEYTLLDGVDDDEEYEIEADVYDSTDEKAPAKRKRYVRLLEEEVELQECNLQCRFSTTFASLFEKHLSKTHSEEREVLSCHRVSCDGELFDTLELLRQHKNDVHSTHICMTCGNVSKHLIALENHIKGHERERAPTLQCTMCDELFRCEPELQRHSKKVHLVRYSFECSFCGLGFKHKLLLTQHLLTHSMQRNYNCELCDTAFKTANHLRRHVRTVHAVIRYNCDHCHITYGRRDKLRMHMERVHEIQTYFVCDICCFSFETDDKLQEHKNRHERPRDLECGICLTPCTNPEEFNEHLCITYQDDYICCKRDFRYHSYYNRHMFLTHCVKTNARVKPNAGVLMGKQRALRVCYKWLCYFSPNVVKTSLCP